MAKGKKTGGRDFKPGQSGNPAGRPKGSGKKLFTDALRAALEDPKKIQELIGAILEKALKGDIYAIREIVDRLEGKAEQSIKAEVDATFNFVIDKEEEDY